jgi:hypothetical protein
MSSYNSRTNSSYSSSSDRSRGPRYNGERYIPRDGDDRREEPRREEPRREEPRREEPRREEPRREDISTPSICIPRTFPTIRGEQTKRAVFRTFRELRIGFIDRIDTVHKTDKNGERFCTVYVHMKNWNMENQLARDTRQKLLDGQEIKVVYDEPWFWKCTASTIEKPENRYSDGASRGTARPRIDLGEGVTALSRYTNEERREEEEEHNQGQLCNMDPEEEEDE